MPWFPPSENIHDITYEIRLLERLNEETCKTGMVVPAHPKQLLTFSS